MTSATRRRVRATNATENNEGETMNNNETTDTTAALLAAITALTAKVEAMEAKGTKGTRKAKAPKVDGTATTATLLKGTRPGYLQLDFGAKPTEAVRTVLKAHMVRYAPTTKMWFGSDKAVRGALKDGKIAPTTKVDTKVTFTTK